MASSSLCLSAASTFERQFSSIHDHTGGFNRACPFGDMPRMNGPGTKRRGCLLVADRQLLANQLAPKNTSGLAPFAAIGFAQSSRP